MKTLLKIMIGAFLLSACIPYRTFDEPDLPWVERFLESSTCSAPCWEGIIPGETTLDQVDEDSTDLANRLGYYDPQTTIDGQPYKYWFNLDGEEKFHGVTLFARSPDDLTIDRIQFEFGNYGSHLRVMDILSHFGEPDSVAVDILAGGCRAALLYPTNFSLFTLERKKLRKTYEIEEETLLSWSYYYSKNAWNSILDSEYPEPSGQIQPWTGFGNYACNKEW